MTSIFQKEDATAHTLLFPMTLQHNTQWKNISKDAVTKVTYNKLILYWAAITHNNHKEPSQYPLMRRRKQHI